MAKQEAEELDDSRWKALDVDLLWRKLGRFGKYQMTQLVWLCLLSSNIAVPIFCGVFTGMVVDFKCASKNETTPAKWNETLVVSSCYEELIDNRTSRVLEREKCDSYDYSTGSERLSYIAEWDLVCDRETLGQLPQILTMLGMALGASFLTPIGDRFGRKKLVVGSSLALLVVMLGSSFVEHFELFLILKLLSGVFQQSRLVPRYAMTLEVLPTELRSMVGVLEVVCWVVGMGLVAGVAYFMRDFEWRTHQLVHTGLMVYSVLSLWFMDESIRWYLDNSRKKDTERLLRKACRMNGKDYDDTLDACCQDGMDEMKSLTAGCKEREVTDQGSSQTEERLNIKTILTNRRLRTIALVMGYTWMNSALTFYGLTLLSTSLAGNIYLNFILMGLAELPSAIVTYYCIQRFGRKRTIVIFHLITAAVLIIAVLITNLAPSSGVYPILVTTMSLMGKMFVSGSFAIAWIYTHELYPTNLRGIGVGLSSTAARIAGCFSPLFTILARKVPWAPGAFFATACLIGAFLLTFMPETRWVELPRNVEDVEQMFGNKKINVHEEKHDVNKDGTRGKIV